MNQLCGNSINKVGFVVFSTPIYPKIYPNSIVLLYIFKNEQTFDKTGSGLSEQQTLEQMFE